jgi:hypothetical protein
LNLCRVSRHGALSEVLNVTPRSRLLAFDVRNRSFPFQGGQAIIVGAHGAAERRPYSSLPLQMRVQGKRDAWKCWCR